MGELPLKGLEEGPVISIGKHAAILQATYDGKPAIIKSFRPEEFEREYAQMQANPSPITMEGGYKRSPPYYFEKEERVLYLFTEQAGKMVVGKLAPEYYNCIPSRLQVVMEYIGGPTYRDKFVEVEDRCDDLEDDLEDRLKHDAFGPDEFKRQLNELRKQREEEKRPYWERMLEHMAHFNLAANIGSVRKSLLQLPYDRQPLVDLRTKEEERHRLAHYIRLIVFTHSAEFNQRYIPKGWEYTSKAWKSTKKNIRTFLREKGIDLPNDPFVDRVLERHRRILYGDGDPYTNKSDRKELIAKGKLAIVHGDFGPQNVFYDENSKGKVIDFDELRLDSPQFDVVHGLYHVASNPSEPAALRLLHDFFTSNYPASQTEWSELLCEHIGIRLIEGIRKIASDDRMSLYELRKFAGGFKRAKTQRRGFLLNHNFNRHREFIQFYRDENGWAALAENKEKSPLVLEQLADIGRFFHQITTQNDEDSYFHRELRSIQKSEQQGQGENTDGK